jgi:ribosomal protein S12 methylthiotransferase accessory factor
MVKHYKDLNPKETIDKIKNILEANKIIVNRQTSSNALDTLYSCRIGIKDTPVGVNGKGLTEELSIASGLAEFLERLQNQVLINPYDIAPEAREKFGFIYDIHEKLLPYDQFLPLPEDFKKSYLNVLNGTVYELWDKFKESAVKGNSICHYKSVCACTKSTCSGNIHSISFLPYYNTGKDKVDYLPYRFLYSIYTTNGMCGGNSPQEALVQAICEIFERHVQAEIYFKELTPPTIPMEYIKEHAHVQYELIKKLEDTGAYKIIVKDCSLGKGFPVIGTIVIFRGKNKYAFKFGSDPDLSIALERCLTEYFQGRKIFQDYLLSPVNTISHKSREDYEKLYLWFTTTGYGQCSDRIFHDRFSYEFSGFPQKTFTGQKQRFDFVVDLVKSPGYNMFVRDVSFLGFNSYHVVIPGLSEEYYTIPIQWHRDTRSISRIEYLNKLDTLDIVQLKELADDMEFFLAQNKYAFNRLFLLGEYTPSSYIFDEISLNKMSLHVFLTYLHYNLREFEKAYRTYNEFTELLSEEFPDLLTPTTYALREFLALSTKYPEEPDRIGGILNPIYGEYIVDDILHVFKTPDNLIKRVVEYDLGGELISCWNCEKCNVASHCPYKYIEHVYLNLKERAMKNPIDQMTLRSLFH